MKRWLLLSNQETGEKQDKCFPDSSISCTIVFFQSLLSSMDWKSVGVIKDHPRPLYLHSEFSVDLSNIHSSNSKEKTIFRTVKYFHGFPQTFLSVIRLFQILARVWLKNGSYSSSITTATVVHFINQLGYSFNLLSRSTLAEQKVWTKAADWH